MDYRTWKAILRSERLPAAVVDLEAFDRNVARTASIVQRSGCGQTLRLATKSLRVPDLIARIVKTGRPYQGLMCFSAEEALFLASRGFDDFLVAYPTVQPSDLKALRELQEAGRSVKLIVDSLDGLKAAAEAMTGAGKPLPLVLEVDLSLRLLGGRVHLGVRRSPIRTPGEVVRFFQKAEPYPSVRLIGVMGYEAQTAGLGDRNPFHKFLNPAVAFIRSRSVSLAANRRAMIAEALNLRGLPLELFNGGGTGSLNYSIKEACLTEVSAGSAFLCPHLFDYYSNIKFEPACFFALQAVRSSDSNFITCQGGGYIASGQPGWDKTPVPYLPEGLKLAGPEGCGEVQTPLKVPPGIGLRPGDPILFRHAKAGELAERFKEYLLVSKDKIVGRAPTYRGLGRCFF